MRLYCGGNVVGEPPTAEVVLGDHARHFLLASLSRPSWTGFLNRMCCVYFSFRPGPSRIAWMATTRKYFFVTVAVQITLACTFFMFSMFVSNYMRLLHLLLVGPIVVAFARALLALPLLRDRSAALLVGLAMVELPPFGRGGRCRRRRRRPRRRGLFLRRPLLRGGRRPADV